MRIPHAHVLLLSVVALALLGVVARDAPPAPAARDAAPAAPASADALAPLPWPKPRAIVLVLIDTLRADHVGPRPGGGSLTPALDRLAERAYVLTEAMATSSWTRSSIASLFTSRYPGSVRVLGRDDAIAEEYLTVAEALRDGGWRTAAVFANGNASPEFGFGQGFEHQAWPKLVRGYPGDFQKITAEGVTHEAMRALAEWRATEPERPFFLFVHYIDPHDPYLPHPEQGAGPEPPGRFSGAGRDLVRIDDLHPIRLADADVARIKHLYEGEVRYCDAWVGRLLDDVRRAHDDEALVIVTADHGEGLWDHGKRGHGVDLHQEQIHVPLIVRYPGMAADAARRIAAPVSLIDLAPTILHAAGLTAPAAFEGRNLGPLLAGTAEAGRDIYAEMDLDRANFEAVRTGPAKLIRRRGPWALVLPGIGLYDLGADPGEQTNLARAGATEPLRRRLVAMLGDFTTMIRARAGGRLVRTEETLRPELREQLRGLGYLQ